MGFKRDSAKPSSDAPNWTGPRYEYRARNLKKVPGMGMEADFNEHGAAGWEFVAVADGYAIFKRPVLEELGEPWTSARADAMAGA